MYNLMSLDHSYILILITVLLGWVQFSCSVVANSLRPCELQYARPPYPSPTPRVHPNPCPLSRWCHPTISSSVVPFSSCPRSALDLPSIFPSIRVFSDESALRIRWPKYWSFSFNISPSKLVPIKFYRLITNREMTIKRAFLQSWDFCNSRSKYNFLIKYPAVSNVKGLKQWSAGNFITKDKPSM